MNTLCGLGPKGGPLVACSPRISHLCALTAPSPSPTVPLRAPFLPLQDTFMSRLEFLNPEGLRVDGRRAAEARHFDCKLGRGGARSAAEGHAFVAMGNTQVLAEVHGPRGGGGGAHDRAVLTVQLLPCAFGVGGGGRRGAQRGRGRKEVDLGDRIRQTFEVCPAEALISTVFTAFCSHFDTDRWP